MRDHTDRCSLARLLKKEERVRFTKNLLSKKPGINCILKGCGAVISAANYSHHFQPKSKEGLLIEQKLFIHLLILLG